MKKIINTIVLLFTILTTGQENKFNYKDIYNKGIGLNKVIVQLRTDYDQNNKMISQNLILLAQDLQYKSIVQLKECYNGSPEGLLQLLDYFQKFYDENENGMYQNYKDLILRKAKFGVGVTFKENKSEIGFFHKDLEKIKKSVKDWIENSKQN